MAYIRDYKLYSVFCCLRLVVALPSCRHFNRTQYMLTVLGPQAHMSRCLRAVEYTQQPTTTYVYVVVRAYACCHLSRYKVSIVLYSSLIPLVVSASLR